MHLQRRTSPTCFAQRESSVRSLYSAKDANFACFISTRRRISADAFIPRIPRAERERAKYTIGWANVDRTSDLNLAFCPPRTAFVVQVCLALRASSTLIGKSLRFSRSFPSFFLSLFPPLSARIWRISSFANLLPAHVSFLRVTLESPPNKLHRIRTSRRTAQQWTQDWSLRQLSS